MKKRGKRQCGLRVTTSMTPSSQCRGATGAASRPLSALPRSGSLPLPCINTPVIFSAVFPVCLLTVSVRVKRRVYNRFICPHTLRSFFYLNSVNNRRRSTRNQLQTRSWWWSIEKEGMHFWVDQQRRTRACRHLIIQLRTSRLPGEKMRHLFFISGFSFLLVLHRAKFPGGCHALPPFGYFFCFFELKWTCVTPRARMEKIISSTLFSCCCFFSCGFLFCFFKTKS